MIKKISYSFLFFLCVQFVLFSCCKTRSFNAFLESISFNVAEEFGFTSGEPVSNEDLVFRLETPLRFIEVTSAINTKTLINTANATSCPDDNILYLNKYTAINVTSNSDVLGITAGESLNNKLVYFIYDDSELAELSELTDPNNVDHRNEFVYMKFTETIASDTSLELTIIVTTELGQEFTATTETFTIQ